MTKIEIYNKYLSNNMHESELIQLLDNLQEKKVKDNGVIYTPWSIVEKMISITEPSINTTIVEPSCGHGIFLFGLLNYIKSKYNLNAEDLLFWFQTRVTAIELSKDAIIDLKEILSLYFKKHFNKEILNEEFINIKNDDALFYLNQRNYDLCIGNPPYIRTKNLDLDYLKKLRSNFITCEKGNIDIYYAFIERFLKISNKLCLITPNSFLTNVSAKKLKDIIFQDITHLIDFKDKIIFTDARTYTCIFQCHKNTNSSKLLYANDINDKFVVKDKEDLSINIGEVKIESDILSGLATLCDSVYLVKKKNNKFYATFEEKEYEIDKGMVAPYIKITKIKSDDLSNINYMIYPYDINKKILSEEYLKEKYPLTYTYLLVAKKRLLQRDKGKTGSYESWYAYGRKQGLHSIVSDTAIIIPQMIGLNCVPILITLKDLLKEFGKVVFTSGYLIPNVNKKETTAFLSRDFLNFAKSNGKAWPGKIEPYYSLTAKQIRQFKII